MKRSTAVALWRIFLMVLYAAAAAWLLVHWLTPCEAGTLCMGVAGAPWHRRLRAVWDGNPPSLPVTPMAAREEPQDIAGNLHAPLVRALRSAWHGGHEVGERAGHITGWRSGVRVGLFLGVYIGTPLVVAGYYLGRWVLRVLGWL